MNDEERDQRIETLTDAIADVNRAVAQTTRSVEALTERVDALAQYEVTTKQQLGILAGEVTNLARLFGQHLVVDHGYPPADNDDA